MCETETRVARRAKAIEQMSHGIACIWHAEVQSLAVVFDVGVLIYQESWLPQPSGAEGK